MERRATARLVVAAAGRERELERLEGAWERARSEGAPAFARLHGPPGIGKTHLLRALARRFEAVGTPVIAAAAGRGSGEALALLRDLARGLLALAHERGFSGTELATLTSRLAPLLDGSALRPAGRRPADVRLDVAEALAALLRGALPEAPVLVLDDLDAADRGSLEVLQYLSAVLLAPGQGHGCLVVVSHRDGELPQALAELVDRVPGLQLPLAPLDLDGVRSFLARPDVAERLLEATSGDPSRLDAVLRRAPADLAAWRLARLEGEAHRVLLAAAVLGRGAPASLLLRVAEAREEPALLERLVTDGFLQMQVEASGPCYLFGREGDRQRVLAAASAEQLAAVHVAAGRALAATGAGVEEVARHFLAGDPAGEGATWAGRAAERLAARCAFDAAIPFFEAALAGENADTRKLHLGLAAAWEASGDLLRALCHLGRSRRHADEAGRRAARSEAARLCIRIGKLAQAERLCRRVLGTRTGFDPTDAAAARAWADLAEIRFLRADFEGAIAACDEGIPLAAARHPERLALRNTRGKAFLTRGNHREAAAAFRQNAVEADAAGLARESMLARINEGVVHHRTGERQAAIRLYREGLALGDDRSLVALALGNLAVLYHEVGEVQLALEHYDSALAAFTLLRRGDGVAHQGINRARLLLFLGAPGEALAAVAHARREAERLGNPYLVGHADLVEGEIKLRTGDAASAVAPFESAHAAFERLGSPRYVLEAGIAHVQALLAHDAAGAAARLPALQEKAAALDAADLRIETALLAAEVALARGRAAEALPGLDEARAALLERPHGVGGDTDLEGPWRLYDLLARCHEALGERVVAASHRERARTLLEALRERVPTARRAAFASLPARAALLADGESREIGPARAGQVRARVPVAADGPALVGNAPSFQAVLRRVAPVGRSLAAVLVRGESGTGKESLATALHRASPRAALPLVKATCTLPQERLAAELFGEAPGRGRFAQANGGTLFLDEIGALPLHLQVELLRVLESRQIERPGHEAEPVDVRVICATSRNLEELLAAGRLREDLYYRLRGVTLELPPLRERPGDVALLAGHFLARLRQERGEGPVRFSDRALQLLAGWSWPGNVRELAHLVEAVAIFAEGEEVGLEAFELHGDFLQQVGAEQGGAAEAVPDGPIDFYALAQARGVGVRELRHELELQMIRRALLEAKGNISEAARLLQMKRSRLSQIVNSEPDLVAVARGLA